MIKLDGQELQDAPEGLKQPSRLPTCTTIFSWKRRRW